MNLALEASLVSCEGRLGCLHQKLLIVICGPIPTYTYHLNIFDVDFLHEMGFCRTILLSEYMPYFCLLPGTSSSKIILNEKLNLYLSHTFDNILSTLQTIYLLADLIILLWWVHANANLILTVHPGFLFHSDETFQFHCSQQITPFCLAEFPNICISCWLFGSGVGWRATLIGEKFVTPKAQRKEQQKWVKQKHTSILLI